ncbi:hypothetical protein [Desulfomicrobium salsuginis]
MTDYELTTPVAFIIFNRPDTTARVFAEIAKARPPKLLVIGDGPRVSRLGEVERVAAARAIIEKVDWPCEVLTNFSEVNLGCKRRVSSGIDWVFEQVEEAIILEDDCLPHPTFFRFCQEMLERYRYDERIAMISGDNFLFDRVLVPDSYYFSRYLHIWGWASWRRAWKDYDVEIRDWPQARRDGLLAAYIGRSGERSYWLQAFNEVHQGLLDTWDYQWVLSSWLQSRLAIMPAVNLVSNIGFGQTATHTTGASIYANMPTGEIVFPLCHPRYVFSHQIADVYTAKGHFTVSLRRRILNKVKKIAKSILKLMP